MKNKLLNIIIVTSLLFLSNAQQNNVHAADFTVTCDDSGPCNTSPAWPMFNETNGYPGMTVSKSFQTINNDENDTCHLKLKVKDIVQQPSTLAQMLNTWIKWDTTNFYGPNKTLHDAANESYIDLGYMTPNGGSNSYIWEMEFDETMGNEYQGSSVTFSFDLNFTCDHDEGDNDDDDDGDGDGGGDSEPEGAVAGITTFFFPTGTPPVLGDSDVIEPVEIEETPKWEGVVGGIEECIDPWWWFLVFGIQLVLHLIVFNLSKNPDRKSGKMLLQLVIATAFAIVFWKFFCPKWDLTVSLIIGLGAILLQYSQRET